MQKEIQSKMLSLQCPPYSLIQLLSINDQLFYLIPSHLDKLRLLMIYIISQEGIKDGDKKRLLELAKISPEEEAIISNLRYLGITLLKVRHHDILLIFRVLL